MYGADNDILLTLVTDKQPRNMYKRENSCNMRSLVVQVDLNKILVQVSRQCVIDINCSEKHSVKPRHILKRILSRLSRLIANNDRLTIQPDNIKVLHPAPYCIYFHLLLTRYDFHLHNLHIAHKNCASDIKNAKKTQKTLHRHLRSEGRFTQDNRNSTN